MVSWMSFWLLIQFPVSDWRELILFFLLLLMVEVWKNLILALPSDNQSILDLSFQNSYLCLRISLRFWIKENSREWRKELRGYFGKLWMLESLARILYFLWKIFPMVSLFQDLMCVRKWERDKVSLGWVSKEFLTTSGKVGWKHHVDSNLKGLLDRWGIL